MDEITALNEILRASWSLIIALLAVIIAVVSTKKMVRFAGVLLTIGYTLNTFIFMFSSYQEEEFIRWVIRLGVTFLIVGLLYGESFIVPQWATNPFTKLKSLLNRRR